MTIAEKKVILAKYAKMIGGELVHCEETEEFKKYGKVTFIAHKRTRKLKRGAIYTCENDPKKQIETMFRDFSEWNYFKIVDGQIVDTFQL